MASSEGRKPLLDQEKVYTALELLSKVPYLVGVALLHVLGLSTPSKYLSLRTHLVVAGLRAFLTPRRPKSVTEAQALLQRDPGVRGRIWVSTYAAPAPPEEEEAAAVLEALVRVVDALRHEGAPPLREALPELPEVLPVEAEWTGYRAGVADGAEPPPVSEREKYGEMMRECKSPATILYFHGGAYWLMDPCTHRPATQRLAELTGGRCYSVRYRLAPQNPFPAALLDALVSYLTLLYPPPGAFHEAVKPEHLVVSGDSAGGNLSLALIQVLLELRRQGLKVRWLGQERDVPLPAGVALSSPWIDPTHSMPSWGGDGAFDYLPAPRDVDAARFRPCAAWPARPPRKALYAADALLTHPLVSLGTARSWRGAPPVYLCTGWERLADEDRYAAARLRRDGVAVVFEEYEAMPHCFALVLRGLPGARRCFEAWAGFVARAVEDPAGIRPSFVTVKAGTLEEVALDPEALSPFADDEVRERVFRQAEGRVPGQDATDAVAKF